MIEMEPWEIAYRKKLNKELHNGSFKLGGEFPGDMILYTGKGGYIEYLVSLRKEMIKIGNEFPPPEQKNLWDYLIKALWKR